MDDLNKTVAALDKAVDELVIHRRINAPLSEKHFSMLHGDGKDIAADVLKKLKKLEKRYQETAARYVGLSDADAAHECAVTFEAAKAGNFSLMEIPSIEDLRERNKRACSVLNAITMDICKEAGAIVADILERMAVKAEAMAAEQEKNERGYSGDFVPSSYLQILRSAPRHLRRDAERFRAGRNISPSGMLRGTVNLTSN